MDHLDETFRRLTIPVTIAAMAGFARFLFSRERSLLSFFRGVTIAGFVGLMTSLGLQHVEIDEGMKGMIIGITSFCADEVAQVLIALAKEIQKDPFKYIYRVIDAFRSQK